MFFPNSTPSTSNKREINQNTTSSTGGSNVMFPVATPVQQIYSHDNPHFMTANHNNSSSSNPVNFVAATPSGAAATGGPSRTYKTRERLYYETDYVKSTNSPLSTASATASTLTGTNSALFEPFVRKSAANNEDSSKLAADELPPTASIHEFLLNTNGNTSAAATASNSGPFGGSPMVINGVIGASPMKSNRDDPSVFVVGAGLQQMTRSITVFGFPPNCRNEILVSFQGHGAIESFDISNGSEAAAASSNGSNWIHVVYESEWAAQKALSRNGSIFQPAGVMIGVIPMQMALEKVNLAADSFMSPVKTSKLQPSKLGITEESIFLSQTAQLKAASETTAVKLEALPDDSSIVTKAVNYIFGW